MHDASCTRLQWWHTHAEALLKLLPSMTIRAELMVPSFQRMTATGAASPPCGPRVCSACDMARSHKVYSVATHDMHCVPAVAAAIDSNASSLAWAGSVWCAAVPARASACADSHDHVRACAGSLLCCLVPPCIGSAVQMPTGPARPRQWGRDRARLRRLCPRTSFSWPDREQIRRGAPRPTSRCPCPTRPSSRPRGTHRRPPPDRAAACRCVEHRLRYSAMYALGSSTGARVRVARVRSGAGGAARRVRRGSTRRRRR